MVQGTSNVEERQKRERSWTSEVLIKPRERHNVFRFLPDTAPPSTSDRGLGPRSCPITLLHFYHLTPHWLFLEVLESLTLHGGSLNMTLYLSLSTLNIGDQSKAHPWKLLELLRHQDSE